MESCNVRTGCEGCVPEESMQNKKLKGQKDQTLSGCFRVKLLFFPPVSLLALKVSFVLFFNSVLIQLPLSLFKLTLG